MVEGNLCYVVELLGRGYVGSGTALGAITYAEEGWEAQTGVRLTDRDMYGILLEAVFRENPEALYPFALNLFVCADAVCLFNINLSLVDFLMQLKAQVALPVLTAV